MFKDCRILNKITNENYFGQIDIEFQGKAFYNLIEIPNDGKVYIFQDGQVTEKPIVIDPVEQKKVQLLNYFNTFYPELKALFKPAKDAVLEYIDLGEYDNALRVIQRYPLPVAKVIADDGTEMDLETFRAEFIRILTSE